MLALGFEFWLLALVALTKDGLLSSPQNIGSGESLAPLRAVSGLKDEGLGLLLLLFSKKVPGGRSPPEKGPSVAHGAISVRVA